MILLHGGLGSGEMFGPILPALAAHHQVIAVDLQGHGRTADIDRPIDIRLMADDIAALIDHLGLDKPDIVGYSLGGGVAFFTAVKYPDKVGKLVMAAAHIRRDAIPPEMLAQQAQVSSAAVEFLKDTPMYQLYQRGRAAPGGLRAAARQDRRVDGARTSTSARRSAASRCPTLIVAADADMAPPSHYVEVFKLLDGGLRDGGWMGEGRPKGGHALAILPGLTHYNLGVSPLFATVTLDFLDAPGPVIGRQLTRPTTVDGTIDADLLTILVGGRAWSFTRPHRSQVLPTRRAPRRWRDGRMRNIERFPRHGCHRGKRRIGDDPEF